MNNPQALLIKQSILELLGVNVKVVSEHGELRNGLRAYFSNYTRQNGPVFRIIPRGLKRHLISVEFGDYANPCIEHIKKTASPENYLFGQSLIAILEEAHTITNTHSIALSKNAMAADWSLSVERKLKHAQTSDDAILATTELVLIPLISVMAELIGYDEQYQAEEEGDEVESISRRRERSKNNRLLAIKIHGDKCALCKYEPIRIFGKDYGSIIEVHHVEPLCELNEARVYNPRTDLIPLCPNCHRMIHTQSPALAPEQLRGILKTNINV